MVQDIRESAYIDNVSLYQGDNVELLTLAGWSPDIWWISNTLARRWERGVCICGCNSGGGGDETTIINEDCVEGFKKRLSILSDDKAAEWGEWLDEYRWSDGHTGHTLTYLQDLQRDLWRAENLKEIRSTHTEVAAQVAETRAELESVALEASRFKRLEEALTD